jgi:putative ABC transport system ATP-binding protein
MNRFFVRRPQPKPADAEQSKQKSPPPDKNAQVEQEIKTSPQYDLKSVGDVPSALTLSEAAPNRPAATDMVVDGSTDTGTKLSGTQLSGAKIATNGSTPKLGAPNLVMPNMSRAALTNGEPLIRLNNVVKAYQTPVGEFVALRGINLTIGRGEFVAVVGKSGSGKSTLINMITGIDRPTSGEIFIENTAIHNLAEGPMAEWRGRNVGIIFQFFQLLPMLSCIENVMLPMDFCNMFKPSERESRALHLLEQVDMVEHAYKLPSEVSGGQQQRVAIARALANDPPLLVADEPTGNLDSRTADAVFQLFAHMVDAGKTILMVTHDDEMAHQVRRTITLTDGQIVNQEYHAHHLPESTASSTDEAQGETQDASTDPTTINA